jgi:hypothetical protein
MVQLPRVHKWLCVRWLRGCLSAAHTSVRNFFVQCVQNNNGPVCSVSPAWFSGTQWWAGKALKEKNKLMLLHPFKKLIFKLLSTKKLYFFLNASNNF